MSYVQNWESIMVHMELVDSVLYRIHMYSVQHVVYLCIRSLLLHDSSMALVDLRFRIITAKR